MRDIFLTLSLYSLTLTTPAPPHDIVELNHVVYEDGAELHQVLAWNWDDWSGQYLCDGFVCFQEPSQVRVTPQRDGTTLVHVTDPLGSKRSGLAPYAVHGRRYRETIYPWDVEVANRSVLPTDRRRGLCCADPRK